MISTDEAIRRGIALPVADKAKEAKKLLETKSIKILYQENDENRKYKITRIFNVQIPYFMKTGKYIWI